MKTHVFTTIFSAGALVAGSSLSFAQQGSSEANQVISRPAGSAPVTQNGTDTQQSTGSKITGAVQSLLGRFLGRDQLTLDQLPQPVQNTVRGQAGTAPIQNIRQVNTDGQTSYVISFNRDGQPVDLQVDALGRVMNGGQLPGFIPARAPLSAAGPISLSEVPLVVQNTLQRYSQGARMQSIEKGMLQGQTVYQAAFQNNGQTVELRVDQNGGLLKDAQTDQYLASIGMLPNSNAAPPYQPGVRDWRTAPARLPLMDATLVDFSTLPAPVRDTFLKYAGAGAIDNIQRGMVGGQMAYQAQLQSSGGQGIALRVSELGVLLDDQINDRFLALSRTDQNRNSSVGRPPAWQSGVGASSSSLIPLSNTRSVAFDELPLAVQTTMSGQVKGGSIDRVTQGTVGGRIVYEANVNQGGEWVKMRVADDGSLLDSGSRTLSNPAPWNDDLRP